MENGSYASAATALGERSMAPQSVPVSEGHVSQAIGIAFSKIACFVMYSG